MDGYYPEVFLAQSEAQAKEIILSNDPGGQKWIRETEDTAWAMVKAFALAGEPLSEKSLVLDYGCGIGRMAKKLIEVSGASVLGLDISPAMLYHSLPYVNSSLFTPCPRDRLKALAEHGLQADAAFAIWVLQHGLNPVDDIADIHRALKPGGLFFVVNKRSRYIPVKPQNGWAQWADDGIDVRARVLEKFELVQTLAMGGADDFYELYRKI